MTTLRNQIQIIGHLGQKPEIATTTTGKKYTRFNVATTEKYTTKDGIKKEDTTWHAITLWDKQAETVVQYLNKGSQICISGRMVNRSFVDKDNNKRSSYEILVNDFMFLGGGNGANKPMATQEPEIVTAEDNLPF